MVKLRIAILECDTPVPHIFKKRGSYGNMFKELLEAGADALRQREKISRKDIETSFYDVVKESVFPKVDDIDAVLITGSRHNSFDNDPWIINLVEYTKSLLAQDRVRIIGVCYGHQIIGRAMGAPVGRSDIGWETSVCDMSLTELGKKLFEIDIVSLHQMHRDVIQAWPDDVEQLGSSPRCEIQGMYTKGNIITVQGHPEFDAFVMKELLRTRHEQGIFSDEQYAEAMGRVDNRHDGVLISKAFVKFLLEGHA